MQTRDPRIVAIYGAYGLFTTGAAVGNLPPSLAEQAPIMGQLACIGIVTGSFLIVGGTLWRNRDDGLLIEQVGNFLMAFGSAFYGLALAIASEDKWAAAILLGGLVGVGVGCMCRFVQIQRYVRKRKRDSKVAA